MGGDGYKWVLCCLGCQQFNSKKYSSGLLPVGPNYSFWAYESLKLLERQRIDLNDIRQALKDCILMVDKAMGTTVRVRSDIHWSLKVTSIGV